jgi:hypothetical protein
MEKARVAGLSRLSAAVPCRERRGGADETGSDADRAAVTDCSNVPAVEERIG